MNENKAKVWLARDENGRLWAYISRPSKVDNMWICSDMELELHRDCFPSVSWEDGEPTEAYITLANEPKEQPKHGIDWEQRRYEIVKSIAADIYSRPTVKTVLLNVNQIISAADAIINELKKQSDEL